MKQKKIITDDFFIGNLGNQKVNEDIISCCPDDLKYGPGLINAEVSERDRVRKCKVSWLNVEESNFIEQGLKAIVCNVNDMIWNIEIEKTWQTQIQFTKYNGKGDHFKWHVDESGDREKIRKLSVVYCLSKKTDYTGGEFQIKKSDGGNYKIKFDLGDFIVFPSTTRHRVLPLRSGTRMTMVGWIM